jgi:hypothetical protein
MYNNYIINLINEEKIFTYDDYINIYINNIINKIFLTNQLKH